MSNELAVSTELEIVTPMQLIQRASAHGASIEMMKELFELKLRVEADEAKKAFNEAFTAFKSERIRIVRDKENTQYSKGANKAMYTSLENMVATVTPFLSKHGLATNWEIEQESLIKVTCVLTHTLGHSKRVSMAAPPDDSGAKNKLQQAKSTVTYLKVSTFEAVCGLASAFGNLDDDGNSAGKPEHNSGQMDDKEYLSWEDSIANAFDETELKAMFNQAYPIARDLKDKVAMDGFIRIRDKRRAELIAEGKAK